VDRIESNSFAAVIRAFLASDKFKRLAPSTQTGYRLYLTLAERPEILGALGVTEIRPSIVQQFIDGLAHKPGAQQRARVALKSLEKWAVVRDLLPFPITTGVETVGSDGHHEPWTADQVAVAERYGRPDISRIITLAANTGQRGSDLCRMRWSDIEAVDGHPGINVTQQKTGLKLWVPFTADLRTAFEAWERKPGHILTRTDGGPWRNRHLMSMAWERERDRNKKLALCRGMVLHGLRGYAVVQLRRAGLSPLQVADMVGMSPPMIENYCALANQKQSALAAIHFLDRHRVISQPGKSRSDAS